MIRLIDLKTPIEILISGTSFKVLPLKWNQKMILSGIMAKTLKFPGGLFPDKLMNEESKYVDLEAFSRATPQIEEQLHSVIVSIDHPAWQKEKTAEFIASMDFVDIMALLSGLLTLSEPSGEDAGN